MMGRTTKYHKLAPSYKSLAKSKGRRRLDGHKAHSVRGATLKNGTGIYDSVFFGMMYWSI